jgi:hypothetical protein
MSEIWYSCADDDVDDGHNQEDHHQQLKSHLLRKVPWVLKIG